MTAEVVLQSLVLGLLQGGIYALVACGLTLIYGVMNVVNFAHGEFVTLGMYLAFTAFTVVGAGPYVAALFVFGLVSILAAAAQHLVIRPALKHPQINQMLITIGISTMLVGAMQMIWGATNLVVRLSWARATFDVGDIRITYTRFIAFAAAVAIALGFWLFLRHTRTGMAVRAVAQSPVTARLMGVNVRRVHFYSFGIGTGLAALSGVLIAPVFFVNPTFGLDYFLLPAFVIVVLGTMGNFMGALIGGIIIGVTEGVGGLIFGPALRQLISLAVFVVILLILPRGLFRGRVT